VISLPRSSRRFAPLAIVLLVLWLAACSLFAAPEDKTYRIAAVFPASGLDASIGQAMQRAVDLAVRQNAALGNGYTLAVTHIDEASGSVGPDVSAALADSHLMGIVGPFDSQSAAAVMPIVAQNGIVAISPSTTLPGLTQTDQATAEGLVPTQLHPKGKPVAFFRLPATDSALGKAAADVARASTQAHGLDAHSIFLVDDGTPSANAIAAAYTGELKAKGGSVAGHGTVQMGVADSVQAIVTAIIKAAPDAIFYSGDVPAGAALRNTLTLTGAPQLTILAAGPIADDPGWSAAVGLPAAAANTAAILPAQDLSALPNAKRFVADYQAAYPDQDLIPQSALAYDAAMDEIAAIKSLVTAGKPITRAAVLSAVTTTKYTGVTGTLTFDQNGDSTTPAGFALYTCDAKGAWHYQTSAGG
jgi:branched-chain amino acid transport system substrate-binding protein